MIVRGSGAELRSRCSKCVVVVAFVALLFGMGGCSLRQHDDEASGRSGSDSSVEQDSGKESGAGGVVSKQKLAASLSEWIDQRETAGDIPQSQKAVLNKAKQTGKISTSDYENAWSDYKQCMVGKGYKEIKLIKYPSGLYTEAGHRQGTPTQESQYVQDQEDCSDTYVSGIQDVYGIIVGNPDLYASQSEAVVDCLHRASLVPKNYTADQFNEEISAAKNTSFDMDNAQVRSCLASNGYAIGNSSDETEQLW